MVAAYHNFMNETDLIILLPWIILSAGTVVVMLALAAWRNHPLTAELTLLTLAGAFVSVFYVLDRAPRPVTPLLIVDRLALFYTAMFLAAGFVITLLAYDYLHRRTRRPEEFYLLLLLTVLGGTVLAAARHFASFFLGLELLTVSLYGLIAYRRTQMLGIEAAVKYLVLAGGASAFLLFGMALVYFERGTMEFAEIADLAATAPASALLMVGLGMMIVGVGFKLALAPFHLWTPDVYEGAPAPVSALIASVSKGAVLVILLRFFRPLAFQGEGSSLFLVFAILAIASMFAGNLLALRQKNVKRILAYSSIAHLGYLLVPFLAGGTMAVPAVTYYLVAYFVMILGAFGVVTVLSTEDRDADGIRQYAGLAWRRPWLAGTFTAMLLSLAGLPLTVGFTAKFYLLAAGVQSGLWAMVMILAVNSTIGLYYYLRIVVALYSSPELETPAEPPAGSLAAGVALPALTLLLVWWGIYPYALLQVIETLTMK
jgi:NADH-quinone oxidoreductase subunit N